jgi:hypothetical protein
MVELISSGGFGNTGTDNSGFFNTGGAFSSGFFNSGVFGLNLRKRPLS